MNPVLANQGFAQYWAQGDPVSHLVSYALLIMSFICWYFILGKAWAAWKIRRSASVLDAFWKAPTMLDALAIIEHRDTEKIYSPLAVQSAATAGLLGNDQVASLNARFQSTELMTRVLRQEITNSTMRLESSLTILASVGATAPFVGLLGTVWGIYHALAAVSSTATLHIDKIAGPVGEALIMTAMGLTVAIPAVLAYNGFNRINRITLAELDAFAYDLHAFFSTNAQIDDQPQAITDSAN